MTENYNGLSDSVYEHLLEEILSSRLKPGEKIPEARIASEFGCSRAPIRDAMKRLSNNGIIDIYPRRFARVANYSQDFIHQVGAARIFNDLAATKLAILNGNNLSFYRMKDLNEQCLAARQKNNMALGIKKDCAFHLELSRIGQNDVIYKFAQELYIRIEFIQAVKYDEMLTPAEQYEEHALLVEYLLARNEDKASELLIQHYSRFHNLCDVYPEGFFNFLH